MLPSVAFVGAGPTTIYTLHAFVDHCTVPCALTIFEAQAVAGRGTPYRPGWNDPAMLSNIASIELPPLEETLVDWLQRQSADHLRTFGIDHAAIDDRAFYPRLALGEFFRDQFELIVDRARSRHIVIDVRVRCQVIDAVNQDAGLSLTVQPTSGEAFEARFDHVVMATGHQWPDQPEIRPGYFLSPWPASALSKIPATRVGIRGSSLTAIDAVVAVAVEHGTFCEEADGGLVYHPDADTDDFRLIMMSRKGLLPEADFFHPIPYEPLAICTRQAIEQLIEEADGHLLDRAFSLFKQELAAADPAYASRVGLNDLGIDDFRDRFFADRLAADPFDWARSNLDEAKRNFTTETTIGWRYAILRMHEVIERIVPHLDDRDFALFSRYWKPVFVDDYATVPHESIERMLALRDAGRLELLALGKGYTIDSHIPQGGAMLHLRGQQIHFPVFIEATGQKPLEAKDFPFPSLREQRIIRDEPSANDSPPRGIVIDDQFRPVSDALPADRLFCPSLPFILGRHPFSQGITSSHQMGEVVGRQLARTIERASQGSSHPPDNAGDAKP